MIQRREANVPQRRVTVDEPRCSELPLSRSSPAWRTAVIGRQRAAEVAGDAGPDRHFATTHLLGTLKYRTVTSGVIRSAAQGMQFLLTLGYNASLARLLTPRDFGLV